MNWIIFVSIFSLIFGYGLSFLGYLEIISIPDLAKKFIKISNRVSIGCFVVALAITVFWPKTNRLKWEISKNQLELKIAPIENELLKIKKESGGEILSDSKLKMVEELNSKAAELRKNHSKGKLAPQPQKVSAKPKEETWIFVWMATDKLMEENHQQKPYSEYVASDVAFSEEKLSFVCFKHTKREDKIVLTRESPEQAYVGYLFNKIKREYTPIWLLPENDGFKGYIFANNGPKIIATLKKGQNH